MSEMPTNNFKITYSDDLNPPADQIEFVNQNETTPGSEEGQYIYTMPSAFRFGHRTSFTNKAGLLIMVVGLLLLVGLVYVGFLIITKNPIFNFNPAPTNELVAVTSSMPTTTLTESSPTTSSEVIIDLSDPEQAYLQLRLQLDQALTLEDYLKAFIAGASRAKAQELTEQAAEINNLSESQKSSTLSISKSMLIPLEASDKITKEINGNQATLTITKADTGRVAIVTMLFEDGQWRLDNEHWQDEVTTSTTEVVAPEVSESSTATTTKELLIEDLNLDKDSDQDGLTDKEEALLGTKSDTADSDGDGYDDLTEIRSGYDPAGQGKLTNNRNLKLVEHGPWSVIVPASWTQQLGRDNSAIFRADDGQFIQLTILSKVASQDLASWYQEMFNVDADQVPEITTHGANEVVMSPDGLTYYLTKPGLDDLIALTYNPESNYLLSYNNIFHLMIDNLIIK